jgi:DNA-binding transcriptional LysR family regulator
MTLWQLKVFSTVAKTGSFTKAAKDLHITQPSATTLVQSLSRELSVKLFEKLGIKIHITSAGEEALRYAHQILGKEKEFRRSMEEFNGLEKGKLSVGAAPLAVASFFPELNERFKKTYPDIQVKLKIQSSDGLEKKLLEGEIDLAVLSWKPKSPLLASEPYREEEFVVIAPPHHPLVKKNRISLETLARQTFIAPEEGSRTRERLEQRFALAGVSFKPQIEIGAELGARDAIRGAVASGFCIGIIAKCHVLGDVKAGRLNILNVPALNLTRTTHIAIHKRRQNSPLIRLFRNFLKTNEGRP